VSGRGGRAWLRVCTRGARWCAPLLPRRAAHRPNRLARSPPRRSALWTAALPEAQRPPGWRDDAAGWHPAWGDRCQQLVWIGVGMDEAGLRAMLDGCLLTDAEMALGPDGWAAAFEDDLPPWEEGGEGEEWGEAEELEGEQAT
jgi:hypothetical protein